VGTPPPVVEVTGHHHQGVGRNVVLDQVAESIFISTRCVHQAQVHADGVRVDTAARNPENSQCNGPRRSRPLIDVDVFIPDDGNLDIHGVAVVIWCTRFVWSKCGQISSARNS
jgi:hypothetical protein